MSNTSNETIYHDAEAGILYIIAADGTVKSLRRVEPAYGAVPPAEIQPLELPSGRKCGACGRSGHTARTCEIAATKNTRTCKACGKPGHMAKTCPVDRGANPLPRTEPNAAKLTEDQFDELKHLQKIGDLSSKSFAEAEGVAISEVNRAITSRTYEEYQNF